MERKDIAAKYKWKTEDIYPSDEAWEQAYAAAEPLCDFKRFEGTLSSAAGLRAFFDAQERAGAALERLYLYAHMKHDEDARIGKYTAMQSRAMALFVRFSSESAFAEPELSALDEALLESYLHEESLKDYDYFLRKLIRDKAHVLSAAEEKLLAAGGEIYSQFQNIFSMIDNADLTFGKVRGENGEEIALTHGTYGVLLHGKDRDVRKRARRLKKHHCRRLLRQCKKGRVSDAGARLCFLFAARAAKRGCGGMRLFQPAFRGARQFAGHAPLYRTAQAAVGA